MTEQAFEAVKRQPYSGCTLLSSFSISIFWVPNTFDRY